MKPYHEQDALKVYILEYGTELFTPVEHLGFRALRTEAKAAHASPKMAAMLRERWGVRDDPEVVAALRDGGDAFRERVFQRILREHGDSFFIHRCPKCQRIARTPRAQQCRWCLHDWHHIQHPPSV